MTEKTQRRGLGRGLGSLIPTAPREEHQATATSGPTVPAQPVADTATADWIGVPLPGDGDGEAASQAGLQPVAGARFAEIAVSQIQPNARQPREAYDEEAMAELVHSVKEIGLLQPIVVRPLDSDRFELVMGERRWRATKEAGLETIPAIVRETDDDAMLRDALLENLHRSQLNPLEEAAAYQQLLDDFECTHEDLAARIGRSRPQISNTSSCRRRCSAASLRECSPPATLVRCSPSRAPRSRTGWPAGWLPRASRCVASRSWWRWGTAAHLRRASGATGRPHRDWPTWLPGSPTDWTPASRSSWASARAASPSSSPRCRTSSGSSA
jgi:ParB/RepB/Spo0J family partition protein